MCALAKPVYAQTCQLDGLNDAAHLHVLASLVNFCLNKRGAALIDVPPFERETVALGAISSHHGDDDNSQATSATPPSYNLLNYNANINRYFNSNPLLSGDCEGAIALTNKISEDERHTTQCASNVFMTSKSYSNTMTTDTSDSFEMSEPSTSASAISMKLLTTDLLLKHNSNMERSLLKEFKKSRCNLLTDEKENDIELKEPQEMHGIKRCGSDKYENDAKRMHLNDKQSIIAPPHAIPIRLPSNNNVLTLPSYFYLPGALPKMTNTLRNTSISIPSTSKICSSIYYVPGIPQMRPQNPLNKTLSIMSSGMPTRFIYTSSASQTQPSSRLLCHSGYLRPIPFRPIQNARVICSFLIQLILHNY